MSNDEFSMQDFNELVRRLIHGVPSDVAAIRLVSALLAVLDEAGPAGIRALREYVEEKTK